MIQVSAMQLSKSQCLCVVSCIYADISKLRYSNLTDPLQFAEIFNTLSHFSIRSRCNFRRNLNIDIITPLTNGSKC